MKNQGPKLVVITTCNNCEYQDTTLTGNFCNKLSRFLDVDYSNFVKPHVNCPFLQTEKSMLEAKLEEIKNNEYKKLQHIILEIFPNCWLSIGEIEIYLIPKECSLDNLILLKEKLVSYDISILSNDFNSIKIKCMKVNKND